MEVAEGIKGRRSIRKFKQEPIPHEVLTELVTTASYAPSWKNSQTARYYVIESKELLQTLAKEEYTLGYAKNVKIIAGAPALVVLATVKGCSGYETDGTYSTPKEDKWQVFDAGIAAQTFCLAAHAKGLGTVILGLFDPQKTAEAIRLPKGEEIAALIPIGYPDITPKTPARKPAEELMKFL